MILLEIDIEVCIFILPLMFSNRYNSYNISFYMTNGQSAERNQETPRVQNSPAQIVTDARKDNHIT